MAATRKWSFLAAVLIVAIFVAGWFLLIGPKRSEAAGLRDETATQEQQNKSLLQQLAVLKAQQAELPAQRAKLAVIGEQIPDNPALPALVRDLTAASRKVGVSIDTLAPAVPAPAVATAPTTTGTEAAAAALWQVPLTVEVSGGYFELEQFVNKLEGLQRAFLVTGFTIREAQDAGTSEAPPGELTLSLQGRVFMAPTGTATPTQPTPAATPATGQ